MKKGIFTSFMILAYSIKVLFIMHTGWGTHVTKTDKVHGLLLFLASIQVGFFTLSFLICNCFMSNNLHKPRKRKLLQMLYITERKSSSFYCKLCSTDSNNSNFFGYVHVSLYFMHVFMVKHMTSARH